MKDKEKLVELERVADHLGVRVCYEPMAGLVQGIGGLCRVKGEYRIIIDRRLGETERIQIVVDALRRFDPDPALIAEPVRAFFIPTPAAAG